MTELEYYPLDEVADKTPYSEKQLIRMGASGTLPIYILTANFFVLGRISNEEYRDKNQSPCSSGFSFMKLTAPCLERFVDEKAGQQAEVCLESEPYYRPAYEGFEFIEPVELEKQVIYKQQGDAAFDGWIDYILVSRDWDGVDPRNINAAYRRGEITQEQYLSLSENFPPAIKIKDCTLVILADDLKRLQDPEPQAVIVDKPFKDSERKKYLKQIAALSLRIAEQNTKYKKGNDFSVNSIVDDVILIIDAGKEEVVTFGNEAGRLQELLKDDIFKNKTGTNSSDMRESIKLGLKLLKNEK